VVECRTRDREVAGSNLTHFAANYGPAQSADARVSLSLSRIMIVVPVEGR